VSFILDALKKSENERQRQHGPTLVDVPLGKRRSAQPWWAMGVAALLLANLGVLVFVFVRHKDNAATTVAEQAATSSIALPAAPVPSPRPVIQKKMQPAPSAGVRPLAEEASPPAEIEYETVPASAAATVPDGPPLVRPLNGATLQPAPQSTEMVPTINDVGGPAAAGLAELHLDVHVYSQQSNARFVFINTRKYVEGQTLVEGPSVDKITPDGVILSHHGRRFLLPRQ
jgi:general secretion pathway protein B